MRLTYEPSSEPLHISAKKLFLNRESLPLKHWSLPQVMTEIRRKRSDPKYFQQGTPMGSEVLEWLQVALSLSLSHTHTLCVCVSLSLSLSLNSSLPPSLSHTLSRSLSTSLDGVGGA